MTVARASEFVVAIDFGGTKIAVATATLDGEIIASERLDTVAQRGAEEAVRRALEAAGASIARVAQATGGRCAAAGVVSPGVVLADRILLAPNVPGWGDLALGSRVRDALGIDRVAVGTDVKAAGVAEARWGALEGADPGIFLSLGTGLAAAILIGGRVLSGANGAAGEVGYSLRGPEDDGFAEGRAPLEEIAGGRFIGERASRVAGQPLTAAEAFSSRHPALRDLVDRALDELSVHVANLAIALDPERIAVGGGLMASAGRILAALEPRLRRAVPFPPELVCARFTADAALRGAVALAADAARAGGATGPPLAAAAERAR